MPKPFQPRFENGIYRDCKWCQGRGCLSCPGEADKEYKRQFPDGPKPIVSLTHDEVRAGKLTEAIAGLVGEAEAKAINAKITELFDSEGFAERVEKARKERAHAKK